MRSCQETGFKDNGTLVGQNYRFIVALKGICFSFDILDSKIDK